jgi:hypothetical protein
VTPEEKVSRLLTNLQRAIRASGISQTKLDAAIGRRRGFLSHVFQRRINLKVIDLMRALSVLEVEPVDFMRSLNEPPRLLPTQPAAGTSRAAERARAAVAPGESYDLLLNGFSQVVRRVLTELGEDAARGGAGGDDTPPAG